MDETVALNEAQGPDDAGEVSLATGEEAEMLPDDYYRSQKEVDAAFKKRLEREKQRWERDTAAEAETKLQELLQEGADAAQDTASVQEETNLQDSTNAQETMDAQGREDAGEGGWDEDAFLAAIRKDEEVIAADDPDFDLAGEMEKNPAFALMLAQGLPLKRVYDFFHGDTVEGRMKQEMEQEIVARIRARNNRPAPIGSSGGEAKRDISRMSDAEILEIDARVRRGERITL